MVSTQEKFEDYKNQIMFKEVLYSLHYDWLREGRIDENMRMADDCFSYQTEQNTL